MGWTLDPDIDPRYLLSDLKTGRRRIEQLEAGFRYFKEELTYDEQEEIAASVSEAARFLAAAEDAFRHARELRQVAARYGIPTAGQSESQIQRAVEGKAGVGCIHDVIRA